MTALTQQLVSAVIDANNNIFQLSACGDMQSFAAARNSGMEFSQPVIALTTATENEQSTSGRWHASISGTTEQEVMQTKTSKARSVGKKTVSIYTELND